MSIIIWVCADCGRKLRSKVKFNDYRIEAFPPEGWGAKVENRLRCTECNDKRMQKYAKEYPGYIAS
jgi:DNA-directed RNA polymerase subunit RPC12/RpoP